MSLQFSNPSCKKVMCGGPSKAPKGRLPIPKRMSFHVVYFLKTLGTRASKIMIPGVKYNVSISISRVGWTPRLLLHCCTTTLTWNWTRSVGESTQPKIALHLWASQHGALNLEICWESREVWLAVVILGLSFVKFRFQGTFYCLKSSKKCVCILLTFYPH